MYNTILFPIKEKRDICPVNAKKRLFCKRNRQFPPQPAIIRYFLNQAITKKHTVRRDSLGLYS